MRRQSQQQIAMSVEEAECMDMFVLWTKLGTKPWEGMVGEDAERKPEDVAAVITMLSWQSDYHRMQESMAEQRAAAAANRGPSTPGKHTTSKTQRVVG
jgi:hypothetical protein